jgi:hypothetical protein
MLTLTYGQLRDAGFAKALTKLVNCSSFKSPRVTLNIAKINKRILDEAKLVDEVYKTLINQYGLKDENGELVPHEGREGTFSIPKENMAEWNEKIKEFNALTVEIDRPPVDYADVQVAAALSPMDVMQLEPLLQISEDAPALKAVE